MSLTSTLSTALTGLSATQRALSVISNNVANASVEGYNRKEIQQSTIVVEGRGVGVQGDDPIRIIDEFLSNELRGQLNTHGRSDEINNIHKRIQDTILGAPADGERGIANHLKQLATSLETLANSPEKLSLREEVLSTVQDLVDQVRTDAERVQNLRSDADKQIADIVGEINLDIQALTQVNGQLARAIPTAELLDRRDQLIHSLSEKIDITTFHNDNQTVAVLTADGAPLLEYSAYTMVYDPASSVSETTTFNPIKIYPSDQIDPHTGDPVAGAVGTTLVSGGVRSALTPELRADAVSDADQTIRSPIQGGRISGLLEARDSILPDLADQLGELAQITRYTLNRAHNDAVSSPPPNLLAGTRTDFSGYNAANNSGTGYLAVVDTSDGSVLSTISIDVTEPSASAIVTQLNTDLGAFGTAAIGADGTLEINLTNPDHGIAIDEGDSAIQVTDTAGHVWNYGVHHYFGMNDLIVQTGAQPNEVDIRSDIQADARLLSNVVLEVDTSGSAITSTIGGSGDNRGIQQLAATLKENVSTIGRGDLPAADRTVGAYLTDIISSAAVTADFARNENRSDKAVLDDLSFRVGTVSGVNMDEELSKLIVYQRAYSVSARIITMTDEMFDTLLNTA